MSPADFWELTPAELNIKIDAYNDRQDELQENIRSLAALIGIAVNNPAKFPKSKSKLKPKKTDENKMRKQAGIIGARLP